MTLVPGIAHRGYSAKYPENTLASFEAALKLQFRHLELDVHMTKDGIPVVIHDATVNRTTNGKGKVIDYTFQEIRTLRADQNEVIPSLEEVLRFANGRAIVNIELKQCGNRYIGMEEAVLDIIRANDMIDQVFVTSFDHSSIVKLRQLSDDIDSGADHIRCYSFHLRTDGGAES